MVTAEKLGRTLIAMADESGAEKSVQQFVSFAERRGLTFMLPDVVRFLEQLAASDEGSSDVVITTARDVSKSLLEDIKSHVKATGETVHTIDESLIGGFTAQTGNKLYDASIRHSLVRLKHKLTR